MSLEVRIQKRLGDFSLNVDFQTDGGVLGILAGTVLAFARALGEYGATSMIAGYTPGRTATISTTVYQLWRTNDDALAFRWVMVNMAISFVVLLAVNMLEKKARRTGKEKGGVKDVDLG